MKKELFCLDCQIFHPASYYKTFKKGNTTVRKCFATINKRKAGDLELVANVELDNDDPYVESYGMCKCGVIDMLIDNRCSACHDGLEDKKGMAFVGKQYDGRPPYQSKEERLLGMIEFGENSDKNLALR